MSYIHPMGKWEGLNELGSKLAAVLPKPAAPAATPPDATPSAGPSPAPKPPTSAPSNGSWVSGPVLLIAGGTALAAYLLFIRGRQ